MIMIIICFNTHTRNNVYLYIYMSIYLYIYRLCTILPHDAGAACSKGWGASENGAAHPRCTTGGQWKAAGFTTQRARSYEGQDSQSNASHGHCYLTMGWQRWMSIPSDFWSPMDCIRLYDIVVHILWLLLSAKSLSETLNFWVKYIKKCPVFLLSSPQKKPLLSTLKARTHVSGTFRGSSRSWRKLRNLRLSRPFCLLWIGETWSAGIHVYIFARSSEYFLLEGTWRNILFADHEQPKRI
jgi:hypothetical protein